MISIDIKLSALFFIAFFTLIQSNYAQSKTTIRLYALEDEISPEDMLMVKKNIENFYECKVEIYDSLPKNVLKFVRDKDLIYAKPLLDTLKGCFPSETIKAVLLSSRKLTVSKLPFPIVDLKFLIRGYSLSTPGNLAIVSTYKLKHESNSALIFKQLLIKTVRHELGHLFGLNHCNDDCLMVFGNTPLWSQKTSYSLCEECTHKLEAAFPVDSCNTK